MVSEHYRKWLVAVVIGWAALGSVGAVPRDSAVIDNSGSTNTLGYRIEVWSDGAASVATQARTGASPSPAKSFTVPLSTAQRFFADLAAARKGNVATEPCMKSASFGSSIHVTWQGWRSPDLTCPPKDSMGTALVKDVDEIREASGVGAAPLRQGPVQVKAPPQRD